jgi:hypothetical protein
LKETTIMKTTWLSSAVAIAMLAIAGSAWADEPGSIGSYKSEVAKHVSAWTIEMDRYNGQLERVLKEAKAVYELKAGTLKARQDAEKAFNELQRAKQDLAKSMADLVASLVVATGKSSRIRPMRTKSRSRHSTSKRLPKKGDRK